MADPAAEPDWPATGASAAGEIRLVACAWSGTAVGRDAMPPADGPDCDWLVSTRVPHAPRSTRSARAGSFTGRRAVELLIQVPPRSSGFLTRPDRISLSWRDCVSRNHQCQDRRRPPFEHACPER